MKINYNKSLVKGDSSSVLTQDDKRIELHIKRRDKSTFMLVCISGPLVYERLEEFKRKTV